MTLAVLYILIWLGSDSIPIRSIIPLPVTGTKFCLSVSGDFYLLNQKESKVYRLSPEGTLLGQFGGRGSGPQSLNAPASVWASNELQVLIADRNNHRLTILTRELTLVGQLNGQDPDNPEWSFRYPGGVVINPAGDWFILDSDDQSILKLNPRQSGYSRFGTPDAGQPALQLPDELRLIGNSVVVHEKGTQSFLVFDWFGNFVGQHPDSLGIPVGSDNEIGLIRPGYLLIRGNQIRLDMDWLNDEPIVDAFGKGSHVYVLTPTRIGVYQILLD